VPQLPRGGGGGNSPVQRAANAVLWQTHSPILRRSCHSQIIDLISRFGREPSANLVKSKQRKYCLRLHTPKETVGAGKRDLKVEISFYIFLEISGIIY